MKKLFVLLLMLPMVAFAQNEKVKTKYEDFASKTGVCTIVNYKVPEVILVAAYGDGQYKDKVSFSLEKMTINNSSLTFLQMIHQKYDNVSSAMLEASDVKALYNAIKEMMNKRQNPKPEGAAGVKYLFLGNDGVSVECDNDSWKIRLERFTKDEIWIADIEPFCNRLQEVIQQIDKIK